MVCPDATMTSFVRKTPLVQMHQRGGGEKDQVMGPSGGLEWCRTTGPHLAIFLCWQLILSSGALFLEQIWGQA